MNLNYRNPTSPITSLGNVSTPLDVTYGTNYSVLSTGGYMEVYSLSDLNYTIPIGQTGLIEFTGNTIPIQFNKGLGTVFSPDVLTLHSDNISSGRRKLGMLVYVYQTKKVYQYTIDNYELLWTAATSSSGPGGPTVVISEFGTTIKNNSVAGQNLINAWTASTIEGVSGYTNLNATWRVFEGSGFSGGVVNSPTVFTAGLTANTFSASTYLGLPLDVYTTGSTLIGDTIFFDRNDLLSAYSVNLSAFTPSADTYVTGFTYLSNTLTIYDNVGNTFPVTINDFTGLTINGDLSATTISGGTFYGDGTNLTGVIFTGGTVSGDTIFLNGVTANTISATTYLNLPIDPDTYVTGFTYSSNTFTIYDNSGNTFPVTVNEFTGITINGDLNVTGNTNLNGLTATTISASTYQNLPTDFNTYVTGFTYSANTFTISDNSGNTFNATFNSVTGFTINGDLNVTGNTNINGLTATTISASTYQNLPLDVYVTGGTYFNGTAVFTNNSGSTFDVTGFSQYFISASTPTGYTLTVGDRWYNTNTGAEYVWNYDGNTYQWVQPSGYPGPQGPQGVAGYSNLLVTTGITNSAETLTTGYTYYGIIHTNIVNLTLPNPTGIDGFNLSVKDESGNAGIYRIRLTSPVGTIDGNNYVDMNINYMSLHLVARNTNWWII